MISAPDLITTAEACRLLGGIDRSTLIRWVGEGVIEARKLSGVTNTYLFARADVERLAAEKATA